MKSKKDVLTAIGNSPDVVKSFMSYCKGHKIVAKDLVNLPVVSGFGVYAMFFADVYNFDISLCRDGIRVFKGTIEVKHILTTVSHDDKVSTAIEFAFNYAQKPF